MAHIIALRAPCFRWAFSVPSQLQNTFVQPRVVKDGHSRVGSKALNSNVGQMRPLPECLYHTMQHDGEAISWRRMFPVSLEELPHGRTHSWALQKQLLHLHGQSQYQSHWVPLTGITSVGAQQGCGDKSSRDESPKKEIAGEDLTPESEIKTSQQSKLWGD